MKRRVFLTIAVFTAIAIMFMPIAPAGATTTVGVTFAGKAVVGATAGGPIGLPVIGPGKGIAHSWSFAAGTPTTPKAKPGNIAGTSVCAAYAYHGPPSKAPGATAPFCNITGSGTLGPGVGGPWCGHSIGSGSASVTVSGVGPAKTVTAPGLAWVSGATILLLSDFGAVVTAPAGQPDTGPFVAVVQAFGDLTKGPAGSCLGGTATDFLVVGYGYAALVG